MAVSLVPTQHGAVAVAVAPVPFPVPVQPQNTTFSPLQYQPPSTNGSSPAAAKRAPVQPKKPFPDALMPYLADKVASLRSGNLTWVVESLYQDLKTHGVRKIAIEAKVREDCEKCPNRKFWVVKDNVLVSHLYLCFVHVMTFACRPHLECRHYQCKHHELSTLSLPFYTF